MIRMATAADIPAILDIYGPYVEKTAISFEYTVPSFEAFTQRFTRINEDFPWLVWEENGKILGYAYGSLPWERAAFQWCAECSIYLRPEAHRKGIGRALYRVLEQLLALQGYRTVYAVITTANKTSVDFHEAAGFHLTASMPECGFKLGTWHGILWMEKRLSSVEMPTSSPMSWKAIVDFDRKFREILDTLSLS